MLDLIHKQEPERILHLIQVLNQTLMAGSLMDQEQLLKEFQQMQDLEHTL